MGDEIEDFSSMATSPERFSKTLGLTVAEVKEIWAAREERGRQLDLALKATPVGPARHRLICESRFRHGKHPFVCKQCWTYLPICICDRVPATKKKIPCEQVLLWTHHNEWGDGTNSGSVLPLLLENTRMLMKGLHDEEFDRILNEDPSVQPVILWPNVNVHKSSDTRSPKFVRKEDLREKKIILVAMEGTWRQARRMVAKLPYPRLSLEALGTEKSILAPLRSREDGPKDSVCTAEAVIYALERLGMEPDPFLLDMVQQKVDRTVMYQGKLHWPAAEL